MASGVANRSTGVVTADSKKAALEQQYMRLLEQRITQLEKLLGATSDGETPISPTNADGDDVAVDGKDGGPHLKIIRRLTVPAADVDGTTGYQVAEVGKIPRVRKVLSKYNEKSGSREDIPIDRVSDPQKKTDASEIACTFRGVMSMSDSSKLAYNEVDVEEGGLLDILKEVIGDSYPGQNWQGQRINMTAPFSPLVHNWDALREAQVEQTEDSAERKQARADLRQLLDHVQDSSELESYFKTRDSNLQSRATTYNTMWTLFCPGTLVIAKPFLNTPQIFIVESPPYGRETDSTNATVECWGYDYNGKAMVKAFFSFEIEKFRGTKLISSLFCYPLKYHRNRPGRGDQRAFRAMLINRGRKFDMYRRVSQGATQMFDYDDVVLGGVGSITKNPSNEDGEKSTRSYGDESGDYDRSRQKTFRVKGRIIVDPGAFLEFGLGDLVLGKFTATDTETSDPSCNPDSLEDDHLLLCPPRVLGYATREKSWCQFKVDSTDRVESTDSSRVFDKSLELDESYKKMIKALVANHQKSKAPDIAHVTDVVQGKGQGLVILLHGPPGVGKTLTAEAIAEATGKPLFTVSVAEIGLDASKAERNLEQMFYLAGRWEAVLLVDEADVFLESRSSETNPNRNALVSVLLRVLEYYQGIMILTTNRITSLDIAVQSRIHLAIRYDDLTKDQMTNIFNMFLKQLKVKSSDMEDIQDWFKEFGSQIKLNGRQIRNAVSSAQALAISNGRDTITKADVREVMNVTRDFQEQLNDMTKQARVRNEAQKPRR